MSAPLRVVLATLLGAALTVGTVALSRVPMTAEPGENGELRLAWRFKSERVERCRTLGDDELAALPAHMRRRQDCERRLRSYRLVVVLNGQEVADDSVRPRGAEGDRPLSVYQRVRVAPGRHEVRITFAPQEIDGLRTPRTLGLDTTLVVAPRQVILVTVAEHGGELTTRTGVKE